MRREVGWTRVRLFAALFCVCLGIEGPSYAAPDGTKLAIVFGNQGYSPPWPSLGTPASDSRAFSKVLTQFGFINPKPETTSFSSKQDLQNIVAELWQRPPFDSLVVYFAGHGWSIGKQAYLVPLQAPNPNQVEDLVDVNDLLVWLDAVPAQHIFLILDSCYAGLDIRPGKSRAGMGDVAARSRVVLTSVTGDQTAVDRGAAASSLFTGNLLRAFLQHNCDLDEDGVCTSAEVAQYTMREVLSASSGYQLPGYERFGSDAGGDMTFVLDPDVLSEWRNATHDRNSLSAMKRFVQRHPNSTYADLAKERMRKMEYDLFKSEQLRTRDVGSYAGLKPGHKIGNDRDGLDYVWVEPGNVGTIKIESGFWIGQTEVTVNAFKKFQQPKIRARPPGFNPNWEDGCQPIVNVSWQVAEQFCEVSGGKLPSEQQWEFAARGKAGERRLFPWGDLEDSRLARVGIGSLQRHLRPTATNESCPLVEQFEPIGIFFLLAPVGQYIPDNKLYDMIGNAAEWTATPEQTGKRVARGGSFADTWDHATLSYRWHVEPQGDNRIGFRCVIEPRAE